MAFKPLFGRAHACLVLMSPVIIPLLLRARNRQLLHPFNELHPKYAPRLVHGPIEEPSCRLENHKQPLE